MPMWDTPRDPARIEPLLETLRQLWYTVPDWRLGQIICNAGREFGHMDPFYLEDDDMLEALKTLIKETK